MTLYSSYLRLTELRVFSYRTKVLIFATSLCLLALALVIGALLSYGYLQERQQLQARARDKAEALVHAGASALYFRDQAFADQVLSGLSKIERVQLAALYDKEGQIFAFYQKDSSLDSPLPRVQAASYRYQDGTLELVEEARFHDEHVGYFLYREHIEDLRSWLTRFGAITASVFACACAITLLLAVRFARLITRPITSLAKTAQDISQSQDFSIRAERFANDELGRLSTVFNEMLDTLEASKKDMEEAKIAAEQGIEAKSEFLAVISHEIRTPMNAIMGFSELLRTSKSPQDTADFIERIYGSSKHLLEIINDILDYSSWSSGHINLASERFDPRKLVENASFHYAQAAQRKGISFHSKVSDSLPPQVIGDPIRLRQIIDNLCVNAIKYSDRGAIRLLASAFPGKQEGKITLKFRILDTGIGIRPSDRSALFEPFQQLDSGLTRGYEGTGLGLALCRKFATSMGGSISCHSVYGKGSAFTFTVQATLPNPLLDQPAPQLVATPNGIALNGHRLKLLCAEDDLSNQIVLKNQLAELGIESAFVANGREAVETLRRQRFDAVIMDARMPQMDGLEATKLIRSGSAGLESAHTRIIGLTAHTVDSSVKACLEAGMDVCLRKPTSLAELKQAIAATLQA